MAVGSWQQEVGSRQMTNYRLKGWADESVSISNTILGVAEDLKIEIFKMNSVVQSTVDFSF